MKKIIFLNIGWMTFYKGLISDSITGGGKFVEENGYGHEIYNFLPFKGKMYGHLQVNGKINIDRLGAAPKDDYLENVLVIWTSKSPAGGIYIVGWYKNATIYRNRQQAPIGSNRVFNGEEFGYYVLANEEQCTILPIDHRILKLPHRGKGSKGRASLWYADNDLSKPFIEEVLNYVNSGQIPTIKRQTSKNGKPWQPDPFRRKEVEKKAIEIVSTHYEKMGYSVDSVEKDNVGWDLEATLNERLLKIEVKGLSQSNLVIELTPNEYLNMNKYKEFYRIAVTTNTVGEKPCLKIFSFSLGSNSWEDSEGNKLNMQEIVSAKLYL